MNHRTFRTIAGATFAAGFSLAIGMAACTSQQVGQVQGGQAKIEAAIVEACGVANAAAALAAPYSAIPAVAGVIIYVQAGCGTAQAVAGLVTKAVNDPSTIAWVMKLSATLRDIVVRLQV